MSTQKKHFDFIVIGSGIAGLIYTLKVAQKGRVALITKKQKSESNTNYAQGGIASVFDQSDSFEAHIQDTLISGAGLCHQETVQSIILESKEAIQELLNFGVRFSQNETGDFDLGREGGHSARRVLHAGDFTGQEIERALIYAIQQDPNIEIFEHHFAIDLITNHKMNKELDKGLRVLGAYVLGPDGIETFSAPIVLLATGGVGKVYLYTSNPDIATGDGIAMAWRAKAKVANLEFMQFHPTSLYHPKAKNFLLSEALRGEGGILRNEQRHAFMSDYHEQGDLAPRDIVARAIDSEMKKSGSKHVYLDLSHLDAKFLQKRFPNIDKKLKELNLDMSQEAIPVVPAAHYLCGGVVVDQNGMTSIKNLFACGEVSMTGFHGANRLASNSLLEALVYSRRAAQSSLEIQTQNKFEKIDLPEWDDHAFARSSERVTITHDWIELRWIMWNYVGIIRNQNHLLRAKKRIQLLKEEIEDYYWKYKLSPDFLELRNITLVASLIVDCALQRKESRGLHYNEDFPNTLEDAVDTILTP